MSHFIITANRLNDGIVIYKTQNGWSEHIGAAETAVGKEAAATLLTAADLDPAIAVGAYEIAVDLQGGTPVPLKYRERLRLDGPSIDYLNARAA
jgi:hypothetical protein